MSANPAVLFRKMYWLSVRSFDLDRQLGCLLNNLPRSEVLLVSNKSWLGLRPVLARDTVKYLGSDTDCVIYDAYAGFNPNTFAQVCGTLKGGGVLILLSPPVDSWPNFIDPEYFSLCGSRYSTNEIHGYFLKRLIRILVEVLHPVNQTYQLSSATQPECTSVPEPFLSHEQEQLVNGLVTRFSMAGSTEVITADRGRGKSASLGIAIAKISQRLQLKVCVTAPQRSAVESLFKALQQALPDGKVDGSGFSHQNLTVRFYPPTVLVNKKPLADLIVVDEAAALSVNLLKKIGCHWKCCWYATTLHGYEGNGQGFRLRFFDYLDSSAKNWNHSFLSTPVRWAEGDPLESLSYRLLLLDADVSDQRPMLNDRSRVSCIYRSVTQSDLYQNESLLRQVFGLLITAHYRTTPNDLRQLLDSPDLLIRLIECEGRVKAVALLVCEGPVEPELALSVWQGVRRPKGDLIPQTWIAKCGFLEASDLQGWRVMRIAVQPEMQKEGLGSSLLRYIIQEASSKRLDFVGAAFAASPDILRFWLKNDFWLNRLSEQRDPVTAQWPALVSCPLNQKAKAMIEKAELRMESILFQQQISKLEPFDREIVGVCMSNFKSDFCFDEDTLYRIEGFVVYQRSFEDTLPELRQLLRYRSKSVTVMSEVANMSDQDRALLMSRVVYMQTVEEAGLLSGYQGKRLQLKQLKRLCAYILNKIEK